MAIEKGALRVTLDYGRNFIYFTYVISNSFKMEIQFNKFFFKMGV